MTTVTQASQRYAEIAERTFRAKPGKQESSSETLVADAVNDLRSTAKARAISQRIERPPWAFAVTSHSSRIPVKGPAEGEHFRKEIL